jgi:hypothetical protein
MKYLIVKGCIVGFGDRLQSLKMCVKYALKHKLPIYVDWTDPVWSHSGESFYTYFDLMMPKFSIDDIPADATVFPEVWKDKLNVYPTDEMIINHPEISIGFLQDQIFSADVIVYTCNGNRWVYNDSRFFGDVFRVTDSRIVQKVKQRQQQYQLSTKVGIHLRGSDRASKIDKSHRMSGLNIRIVSMGMLNGTKFIAVSDDAEYVDIWKARYPEFPVLTVLGTQSGNVGTHNRTSDQLTVSKDLMNVDLLIDFFTLASCGKVLSTSKDSRFAQESQRLSNFIDKILSRT